MISENCDFCVFISDRDGRLLFSSEAVDSFYIGRFDELLDKNLLPVTGNLFSLGLEEKLCVIMQNRQAFIYPLDLCHIEIHF